MRETPKRLADTEGRAPVADATEAPRPAKKAAKKPAKKARKPAKKARKK